MLALLVLTILHLLQFIQFLSALHHKHDPVKISRYYHRPTILDQQPGFSHYGEKEDEALQEFNFLDSFSSQSDLFALKEQSKTNCNSSHYDNSLYPKVDYKSLKSFKSTVSDYHQYKSNVVERTSLDKPQNYQWVVSPYQVSPLSSVFNVEESCDVYPGVEFNEYCPQPSPATSHSEIRSLISTSPHYSPYSQTKFPTFQKHVDASTIKTCHVNPYQSIPINNTSFYNQNEENLKFSLYESSCITPNAVEPVKHVSQIPLQKQNFQNFGSSKAKKDNISKAETSPPIFKYSPKNKNLKKGIENTSQYSASFLPPKSSNKKAATSCDANSANKLVSRKLNSNILFSQKTPTITRKIFSKNLAVNKSHIPCSSNSSSLNNQKSPASTSNSNDSRAQRTFSFSPKLPKFKFGKNYAKNVNGVSSALDDKCKRNRWR